MSEGVNATAVSSAVSPTTATTTMTTATATTMSTMTMTTTTTTTMTTTLECREEPESPSSSPPPQTPQETPTTTATTVRKYRKHSTPAGTFIWIDGKKIRSALAVGKKWPPRPRRVSFPSNDTHLVTGYLEPANPWEHAENVNLEDLISSYKKSCERHCAEPLQNVVTQLEKLVITDDERCAELSLKHEYLDQNHCEPLEEVLKRIQFEKIDLESTSLDDESAVILFDMLEYYESAKHLNMSSNRDIGSRGWHACAHMIKKTTCLEQLEARDITLTQQHMNILKRPLQLVSHLHVLKLENCGLAGRAFVMLVSALKMNTGLKELYLADNGLEQDDAIQLGALLRVNNHLQLLDISNNHIKDEGVRDILDGLITQSGDDRDGKGLSILVLWNNDLTKSSSTHFTQVIAQSITLETLNIGKNGVCNEMLEMAQEALINSRTLLQLGMQSTNLTCKGALLLADIIERNRTLQRIDLRDNNIQMTGLTALSFAMKKNTSITQLDLDDKPWSKAPAAMHQYMDLVTEIRGYCTRNEEPTSTDESTEESGSPQHRSRLSSVSSRKISLTCQTLPRSPPSMTPTSNEIASRSMLEPKRTSGGRLRSPAPSPIPSPVASPIPSPSRSRFVVSRVSEASLSSTNSSASSSPVTPPSLASSPTCFFPSTGGGSSRFRVTVVEPPSHVSAAKSVVTPANVNVTIGFNYRVQTPESADSDDSDSVFRSDVEEDHRAAGNESSASIDISFEDDVKTASICKSEDTKAGAEVAKIEKEESTGITTKENSKIDQAENSKVTIFEDNQTENTIVEAEVQSSANGATPDNILHQVKNSIVDGKKEVNKSEIEVTKIVESSNPEIIETNGNSGKKSEESLRDEIFACFQAEPKKPEPVQRQATSLERLLGLFQHPGSLFSSNSFVEKTETKNPLQDGVNSMIALGDKFQQYLREGRGSGKTGTDDSPSHAPLQRSVSDASRSTIKLDPVKSLSIPQLSNIQATCTTEFSSHKDESKLLENPAKSVQIQTVQTNFDSMDSASRMIFVVEENPTGDRSPSDEEQVPRISDLPLPENMQSSADEMFEIVTSEPVSLAASSDGNAPDRRDSAVETVNNAPLNVASECKTTICAPKLKDIPEYSVLEIITSNVETKADEIFPSADNVDKNTDDVVETKCDSSTTDSINDPSCKNSSLCKIMCDTKSEANVHTLGSMDDVHNFYKAPLSHDAETMLENPVNHAEVLISSNEYDRSTAIATDVVEDAKNTEKKDLENGTNRQNDSSEKLLVSEAKSLEHSSPNVEKEDGNRDADPFEPRLAIVANSIDFSLPVLNNLCINPFIDTESRNAQNDCVPLTRSDDSAIIIQDCSLAETVEEFLPIDATASPIESTVVRQLNTAVLTNNYVYNNSYADNAVTVIKPEIDFIATEDCKENRSSRVTDEPAAITLSDQKIPEDDQSYVEQAIMIPEEFVSVSNANRLTNVIAVTKIEIASTEYDDSVPAAIEQISTSLSEDSDYSSKLSVDDVRTGEPSLNGSTANSPAYDGIEPIVTETSIINNSLECTNSRSEEASVKTAEHRSFVRVAVESVLTSFLNVSESSMKISSSEVKNSESTEDLIFKITDIITTDASSSGIVTTIEDCGDASNLVNAYFEQGQSSRSPTNLFIDKSRNVHRNSQDSGIEETVVSISDDNGLEGNGQPRESFQESVDSGIDSECSSVCARVDIGADVQKERARDPGKSLNVDSTDDDITDFPTNVIGKDGILSANEIMRIGDATRKTEVQEIKSTTKLTEVISVGRCNETTDRSSVVIRSTSPE